ncbi:MAG: polyprenyl synthetase family protein [Candidatus Omnitrophica bacterium]|nr:polyprenyl synthetase family protein [Candidatus Omnitrophota bacterium]
MSLAEIYRPIRAELKAAEALLLKELALRDGLMGKMTRYVARMSGKRLRPALALLAAGLVRNDGVSSPRKRGSDSRRSLSLRSKGENDGGREGPGRSNAIHLAVAVEMIHTATLLHDDVIDGASLRRGLSTLNAKWGDTLSVLSGDYLYSKAFCLLSRIRHPEVLHLMSDTARTVCEGEVAQIQHQYNLNLSVPKYLKIIQWKTASLMGASTQAGALLGGAGPAQAARLGAFGLNFGLAFQILDDTQDLFGEEAVLGKSLGTDLWQGQMTLPLLTLRDAVEPESRDVLVKWFSPNGDGAHSDAEKKHQMVLLKQQALEHKVPAYCARVAGRYLARARSALSLFPASVYKTSLLSLSDYLLKK